MTKRKKPFPLKFVAEPTRGLTPAMKRSMAERALMIALDTYIRLILEMNAAKKDDDWVDQNTSPLGKFAHLQAVKRGRLPGVKHGRRVLVRRADLNSFLAHHSVSPRAVDEPDSPEAVDPARARQIAAEVLTGVGLRLRRR